LSEYSNRKSGKLLYHGRLILSNSHFVCEKKELQISVGCLFTLSLCYGRWSRIAAQLPGRTDNEIKNYWNTRLKKKLRHMGLDPSTHKPLNSQLADSPETSEVDCEQSEDEHMLMTSIDLPHAASKGNLQQELKVLCNNPAIESTVCVGQFSQSIAEQKENSRVGNRSVSQKLAQSKLLPCALVAQGGLTETKPNVPQVFESMRRRVSDRGHAKLEHYKSLLQKVPKEPVVQARKVDANKGELAAGHEQKQPLSPTSVIHRVKLDEDSEDSVLTARDDCQTQSGCSMPTKLSLPEGSAEGFPSLAWDGQRCDPVKSEMMATDVCNDTDSGVIDIPVLKSEQICAARSGELDGSTGVLFHDDNGPSSCQEFAKIYSQDTWGDFEALPLHPGDVVGGAFTGLLSDVEYAPHQWNGAGIQWSMEGGGHEHSSYEASALTPWQRASDCFYNSTPTPYTQELQQLAAILDEI
jgi:hypothetical protein